MTKKEMMSLYMYKKEAGYRIQLNREAGLAALRDNCPVGVSLQALSIWARGSYGGHSLHTPRTFLFGPQECFDIPPSFTQGRFCPFLGSKSLVIDRAVPMPNYPHSFRTWLVPYRIIHESDLS
jgi:hypothetical protein